MPQLAEATKRRRAGSVAGTPFRATVTASVPTRTAATSAREVMMPSVTSSPTASSVSCPGVRSVTATSTSGPEGSARRTWSGSSVTTLSGRSNGPSGRRATT